MAYGAVSFLEENVSRLLTSHADLFSGSDTEEELRLLTNDLISFKTLLEPESSTSNKATRLREVERQIKKVVYAIEDTIDACVTRLAAAAADWKYISGRRRDLVDPAPADLAQLIRSLRKDELKPAMDRLSGTDIAKVRIGHDKSDGSRQAKQEPRLKKAASIMGESMIGLEDEERKLIETLIFGRYSPDKMGITTLIGMPGLGKTTLAWKAYNNEEIQREFPTRIWASVSRDFNPRTIFLVILHEFTSKDMSKETTSDLAKAIRASLQERRFLLVLDDVWTAKAMSTITSALPTNNGKGRVLVTTRHHGVTEQVIYSEDKGYYSIIPPQRLRFLTNDEGWRLLQFKVFGKDGQCPPQLQGLGRHISQRCRGIPMLLLMIAGILMDYVSKEKTSVAIVKSWIELSQSLDKYTRGGSDVFRSVLELSYDRMCDELRDCFLYLGVFPEDYEIPAWTLTRLWISEGFVRPRQGQSLEERAHENIIDLINRNLVIVDKLKSNGEVKTCRIHDTVHDFCKVESEGKEHLFQVLTKNGDGTFIKPFQNDQHRRICIHSNVLEFFSPEPYAPATRSFLSFSGEEIALPIEDIPKIPGAFELVRVLHVKPLVFRIFPLGLTQLVLLKYVVLSTNFKVLPEAISRLRNMMTLVIHTSSRTLAIKADIWRSMVQLRDLRTNASITLHKKPAAGENRGGQHLQTLANISPGDCTLDLFARAQHLQKLGIRGILATMNFDNLEVLNDLENLKLLNDDIHDIMTPFSLPPPDKFPPKLRSLTLSATFLGWEQMCVVGMLENLEVLKLKDNAFVGRCWEVGTGGFRNLEVLHIGYTNIVSWEASDHEFPKLKCLMLRNCEELESLPQVLADVPCLETMALHRLSRTAVTSARKIQQQILENRGDCGGGGRGIKLSIFPPYQ
ncbi:NBS-LRR type resistance protein [Striga asiatica]|uniref:NBS-LRR type resistance protein n=1 Tax=Striga asiatica TaxID=4170 RepID=A0A5A7PNX3_STRAF|nr:NBS-LRR type resistance protein [Striga asiatica]